MEYLFKNTAPAAITTVYAKLHITGSPGEDGTSTPAAETDRTAITFGTVTNGVVSNSADIVWTTVAGTETYFSVSLWDSVGPAGGNCIWVGDLTTPKAVTAGDTFTIPTGSLTITLD
jgi:hypothetical protein